MAHSEVPGFALRTKVLCTPFWTILGFHSVAKVDYDSPEGQIPLYCGTGETHLLHAGAIFPCFNTHWSTMATARVVFLCACSSTKHFLPKWKEYLFLNCLWISWQWQRAYLECPYLRHDRLQVHWLIVQCWQQPGVLDLIHWLVDFLDFLFKFLLGLFFLVPSLVIEYLVTLAISTIFVGSS